MEYKEHVDRLRLRDDNELGLPSAEQIETRLAKLASDEEDTRRLQQELYELKLLVDAKKRELGMDVPQREDLVVASIDYQAERERHEAMDRIRCFEFMQSLALDEGIPLIATCDSGGDYAELGVFSRRQTWQIAVKVEGHYLLQVDSCRQVGQQKECTSTQWLLGTALRKPLKRSSWSSEENVGIVQAFNLTEASAETWWGAARAAEIVMGDIGTDQLLTRAHNVLLDASLEGGVVSKARRSRTVQLGDDLKLELSADYIPGDGEVTRELSRIALRETQGERMVRMANADTRRGIIAGLRKDWPCEGDTRTFRELLQLFENSLSKENK